jgi:phosphoribosyl-AMP cyclohydrolase / phosphoribosyl-ATP pyrophosphohydrolase
MMTELPDFEKSFGLIPAIVQDSITHKVLMLGYMNREAFDKTLLTKRVTFYSRSKKRIWTKGEESGSFLEMLELKQDCDNDTLLIFVKPQGAVCHTGNDTCWNQKNEINYGFLSELEAIIGRKINENMPNSYISTLFNKGINKIAQKLGEEAVELVIEAKDENKDLFLNEAADLLFHFLLLLKAKTMCLNDVVNLLASRNDRN